MKALEVSGNESVLFVRERKRILDTVWVVTLVLLVLAHAIPWGLGILELDFVGLARSVLVFTAVFLMLGWAFDWLQASTLLVLAVCLLQALGICFLAYLWAGVGGIQNPGFLFFFVLVVLASGVIMLNWQPYMMAVLSIIVVWAVALQQSRELQWYMVQLGWPSAWIQVVQGLPLPDSSAFIGRSPPGPAFQFTLLIVFSVIQLALAAGSTALAAGLLRLYTRIRSYGELAGETQALFQAVLRVAPYPNVIVYADNFQIAYANDSFFKRMLLQPDDIVGKTLFDVVEFEQRGRVQAELTKKNGNIPLVGLRLGPETWIANIRFYQVEHRDTDYISVDFQEITELYYLGATFDAIEDALLIVADDERLLYANSAARQLFGELFFGKGINDLLRGYHLITDTLAATQGGERRVTIKNRPYLLSISIAELTNSGRSCWLFWLGHFDPQETLSPTNPPRSP